MANTRSAAKRSRQTLKRTLRNRSVVTRLRTMQKAVRSAEASGDQIRALICAIAKAAKRGVIHETAANRRKARLNKVLAAAKSSAVLLTERSALEGSRDVTLS